MKIDDDDGLRYLVEIEVTDDVPQPVAWNLDALNSVGKLDEYVKTAIRGFMQTSEGQAFFSTLIYQGGGLTVASDGYHDDD